MASIPLTQGKFAIVDKSDYEWLSKHRWFAKKTASICDDYGSYYAARSKRADGQVKTLYMHREITNCPDDKEVDHINHNTLDNQRINLRVCNRQDNMSNSHKHY